jgi:biotin synthase-related radical SAM superfamily protein
MPYPHIFIEKYGEEELSVTLEALPKGNLPVVISYKGTLMNPTSIENSALTLAKLLKVFKFTINIQKEVSVDIKSNIDILESGLW